jgi:CrcB protein
MKSFFWVLTGGGLGSVARWGLSTVVSRHLKLGGLPWGTLLVNTLGCLGVGMVAAWLASGEDRPDLLMWRLGLITGFAGGFTTFSALSWETMTLLTQGQWALALGYSLGSMTLGLLAMSLGFYGVRAW